MHFVRILECLGEGVRLGRGVGERERKRGVRGEGGKREFVKNVSYVCVGLREGERERES